MLLVCLVLFYRLKVTIDGETLCASFGPGIICKRVRLADIVECEPIRIRWWYGWGITLRDGRKFALGTDDLHALIEAIRSGIS
jgi:hypothetical protein